MNKLICLRPYARHGRPPIPIFTTDAPLLPSDYPIVDGGTPGYCLVYFGDTITITDLSLYDPTSWIYDLDNTNIVDPPGPPFYTPRTTQNYTITFPSKEDYYAITGKWQEFIPLQIIEGCANEYGSNSSTNTTGIDSWFILALGSFSESFILDNWTKSIGSNGFVTPNTGRAQQLEFGITGGTGETVSLSIVNTKTEPTPHTNAAMHFKAVFKFISGSGTWALRAYYGTTPTVYQTTPQVLATNLSSTKDYSLYGTIPYGVTLKFELVCMGSSTVHYKIVQFSQPTYCTVYP